MRRPTTLAATLLALVVTALVPLAGPTASASVATPDGWSVVERPVARRVNEVTVVMLVPRGSTPTFSRADVERSVADVARYYARETDGALQVRLDRVVDWMTLDVDHPCSWTGALLDWAEPRIGWSRAPGRHLVAMVPPNGSCPGWANGELGAWVGAGGRTFQPSPDHNFLVHELGHNFSLPHASSVQCGAAWDFSTLGAGVPEGCVREEYGNLLDMMGGSWTLDDALSSPGLDRLGMLPRYYTPRCGGVRRLTVTSVVEGADQRRTVSWADPRDPGVRYWVDFRAGWRSGLQVLRTDPTEAIASTALVRPGDGSDRRQLLRVGEQVGLGGGSWVRLESIAADGRSGSLAVSVPCRAGDAPAASTTTAGPARVRAAHGDVVTVTVRVTSAASAVPTGVVTVRDEGVYLGEGTLGAEGSVGIAVPTGRLGIGRHLLTVAYPGDDLVGSSNAPVDLEVERATTRTSVGVGPPDRAGSGAVATVRVARQPAGTLPRTVRVALHRGGREVAARAVVLRDGTARWALPRLRRGAYRVVAVLPDTATTAGSRAAIVVRR